MKKMILTPLAVWLLAAPCLAQVGGWVLTTDYSAFGNVRAFESTSPWTVSADLAPIPGDHAGRWHGGKVYVVGRGGSNVLQVYDPAGGFALEREFSLGSGLNLQDIAFDSAGDAYVSCYDQAVLLRVDVANEMILDTYDTSFLADADGLPETAWMIAVQDRLFVSVQRLDSLNWYALTGPGAVAVFDMAAEQWIDTDPFLAGVQPIPLLGANPYTRFDPVWNGLGTLVLRVGCTGSFVALDGGVEEINPFTLDNLGQVATEAQLGGDLIGQIGVEGELFVLVSDSSFATSLRRFDPGTGQLTVLDASAFYDHADLAWDGGFQLFVADRAAGASGLRVFDLDSGTELTMGAIPTGLPPFMFVLPGKPGVSSVPAAPDPGVLGLGTPYPNPCNPRASLEVQGPSGETVAVRVIDLRGRVAERTTIALDGAGRGTFTFTGQGGDGRNLAAGVYRVVVQDGDGYAARSVTLVK